MGAESSHHHILYTLSLSLSPVHTIYKHIYCTHTAEYHMKIAKSSRSSQKAATGHEEWPRLSLARFLKSKDTFLRSWVIAYILRNSHNFQVLDEPASFMERILVLLSAIFSIVQCGNQPYFPSCCNSTLIHGVYSIRLFSMIRFFYVIHFLKIVMFSHRLCRHIPIDEFVPF